MLALLACSSSPTPTTVPLANSVVQHDACVPLSHNSTPPAVYACTTNQDTVFATIVKDCSIPEKLTFQTTTRQLLVGLIDLKVISQGPMQYGDLRVLQTVATGTLDAQPVMMAALTFRKNGCVTDLVLWQDSGSDDIQTETLDSFTASASQIAKLLLK